ncbi:MAG TPA: hypothetical protein VFI02_17080 [Armatimonadota bacterium]|nr:hypothetical protein [Armatimonadota bacterium]
MGAQYPAAAGFRDIGTSTMQYVPVIFSGKLLTKFYASSILAAVSNTEYEGEIKKYGDTVKIRQTPDITISDYNKGQVLTNEQPTSTSVELYINKGKYWSFVTDDVDDVQTDIKGYVGNWTDDASKQMVITVETEVYVDIGSDAHADNSGVAAGAISESYNLGSAAVPVVITRTNIVEKIVEFGAVLDEQNIPDDGRFLIIPVWMSSLLKTSDLKQAYLTGDSTSPIRNGLIGSIDRFNIYVSNLLYMPSYTEVLFGHTKALTFATQITKTKVQDNPDGFGMLYRGLQVYGYEVILPEALGLARCIAA